MKTMTLVLGRHMRQPMSGFNSENFEYFHERQLPYDGGATPPEGYVVSAKEGYAST